MIGGFQFYWLSIKRTWFSHFHIIFLGLKQGVLKLCSGGGGLEGGLCWVRIKRTQLSILYFPAEKGGTIITPPYINVMGVLLGIVLRFAMPN